MKNALIALLFVSASAFASSDADLNRVDRALQACIKRDDSNMGMKMCTGSAYEAADKILQRSYDAIVRRLKTRTGEAWEDQNNAESLRRLIAAERAWITYRDAECELQGTEMLGGSGESLVIMGCAYDMVVTRVKAIEKLFAN